MSVSEKLLDLLETGDFDWEDRRQQEAYLKAWARGEFSPGKPEDPRMPVRRDG